MGMITGKVKWFNEQKGFGFIIPDDKTDELFVHYSNIEMDGYKTLKENQQVAYTPEKGKNGMEAKKVTPQK
jgi:CspA family cold shock protein